MRALFAIVILMPTIARILGSYDLVQLTRQQMVWRIVGALGAVVSFFLADSLRKKAMPKITIHRTASGKKRVTVKHAGHEFVAEDLQYEYWWDFRSLGSGGVTSVRHLEIFFLLHLGSQPVLFHWNTGQDKEGPASWPKESRDLSQYSLQYELESLMGLIKVATGE